MAKSKTKKKLAAPAWLKSKWFLLGLATVVAGVAIWGYSTFAAALPTYATPLYKCTSKTFYFGARGDCIKYAQDRLNYYCKYEKWPSLRPPYDLVVDGAFGEKTGAKVSGFQKIVGIPRGPITPTTWKWLIAKHMDGDYNKGLCQ